MTVEFAPCFIIGLMIATGMVVPYAVLGQTGPVAQSGFSSRVSALTVANRVLPDETRFGRMLHRQVVRVTFQETHGDRENGRRLNYEFESEYSVYSSCREQIDMRLDQDVWQVIRHAIDCDGQSSIRQFHPR